MQNVVAGSQALESASRSAFLIIRLATTVGLLLVVSIVARFAWTDYQEAESKAQEKVTALVGVLDAYTNIVIKDVSTALQIAEFADVSAVGTGGAAAGQDRSRQRTNVLHDIFAIQQARMPHLKAIVIVDEPGRGAAVAAGDAAYQAALLSWWKTAPRLAAGSNIGPQLTPSAPATPLVPIILRSPTPEKAQRTLLAALGADFLLPLHRAANYSSDIISIVIGGDGRAIGRAPFVDAAFGLDTNQFAIFQIPSGPQEGTIVGRTPSDGVERLLAYRKISTGDLKIFAGFDRTTETQALAARLTRDAIVAVMMSVLVLVLGRIAWIRVAGERAANRKLVEQEVSQRAVLAALADGVVIQDAAGKIVSWNPAALDILGATAEQITGRTSFDHGWRVVDLDGNDLPGDKHPAMRALATGEIQHNFIMGVDVPGSGRRWLAVNAVPTMVDGKAIQVVASFSDITEIRQQATVLTDLNHELEARVERRSAVIQKTSADLRDALDVVEARAMAQQRMIYILSHDLREPLNGIINFARMLESTDGGTLSASGKKSIGYMSGSALRMKALLDDLLKFVRLEDGEVQFSAVALAELFDDVRADLTGSIDRTGATLTLVDPDRARLLGDRSLLRLLLQNLVMNALKFHADDRAPDVVVHVYSDESHWWIDVRDNGIGIAENQLDRIFDLFSRLNHRTKFEGTGLGLAIARRIAEIHQGTITVKSQLDVGTCFTISLPHNPSLTERSL